MRGQLHWVELAPARHRPYLIVQADVLNEAAPTTIALPVTLAPQRAAYPLTVALDGTSSGLGQSAWIRVTEPTTLRVSQIGESIITLPSDKLDQVFDALATVLGLASGLSSAHLPGIRSPADAT